MGARVGRSIALSSSQTQGHNITRGSLNQGGDAELGGQKAASLKSVLSFCLRLSGCSVAARALSVEQLQSERRIYDPFLIVSCTDESC